MKVLSESMNMRLTVVVLFVLLAGHIVQAVILTPPYFNLVANKRVTATATCGEGVDRELYCKLTGSTATDRETQNYANLIQVILSTFFKLFKHSTNFIGPIL